MTSRTTRKGHDGPRAPQMAAARAVSTGTAPPGGAPTGAPKRRSRALRPSRGSDQQRLADLKAKLGDDEYMNGAILRIATVLSARLTLR